MSTMGDGSIVLGTIELKARTLELHVNSESRAAPMTAGPAR